MKIGVCGIACEKCPNMQKALQIQGKSDQPAIVYIDGLERTVKHVDICFNCPDFPCEVTKSGPISYGYAQYIAGKEH